MAMQPSASASGSIDHHVISPLLLKLIETRQPCTKCKSEFLLGLGEPFEPNPWDLDCAGSEDDDAMLLASQAVEEKLFKPGTSSS